MKSTYVMLTLMMTFPALSANVQLHNEQSIFKNLSVGDGYCLASSDNKTDLNFSVCKDSVEQKWTLVPSTIGMFMIRNESAPGKCLRTLGSGGAVQLGTCSGDGYTSMRLWSVTRAGQVIFLKNKYKNDAGHNEFFVAEAQTKTVKMSASADTESKSWDYSGEIPSPKNPVTGNKKVLLMATHFNDVAPANPELVRKAVFGDGDDNVSLQHYLKSASRGKLSINGTFLQDINLGDRPAACTSSQLLESARKAAREKGIEPNDYNYLFVDISFLSTCKWDGLAATPGNWVIGNGSGHKYWMWSHEFGHNIGLKHITTLRKCPVNGDTVELGSKCTIGSGVDAGDTMGGGGGRMYPVNYQLFAGWLQDKDVPEIKNAGTYYLLPLWQDGGAQGYRITRSDGSVLVLEFRQPRDGFENWPENNPFVKGVTVRIATYNGAVLTNTLVDATPETDDMKDAPLMPGKTLYDTLSGKLITLISTDSSGATIQVEDKD
ncbi:hypothetical protein ACOZB2_26985 [Pantoea endophytica]|uniref:Carbohydrate-binding protein n=1 Tax=Pantoea sp. BJ2 TaxID=3141322 RepID=A0AAU7U3D4_9GAMM